VDSNYAAWGIYIAFDFDYVNYIFIIGQVRRSGQGIPERTGTFSLTQYGDV
jgi:hypothetical protein